MKSIKEFENKIICDDCYEAMKDVPHESKKDTILLDKFFIICYNISIGGYCGKK